MSQTQVVVIGGGIMGVSLIYHLVKAGWRDVVLLEKNDLTHGSTWHAAGLCTHFAHNATVQELRAKSVRLYRDELPEETGLSCGFHPCGAMRITRSTERMDEFKHVAGLSAFTGYPLEVLSVERIAELHPLARLDGLMGGIYEPDDGHVDPSLATQAMAKRAVEGGAIIKRQTTVKAIRREGSQWIVETEDDRIATQHVVNAAGTWGFEIGQMMGMNIPSVPVLHQYLVTDAIPTVTDRMHAGLPELPMIRDPEESWYVRQEGNGLILGPYEKDAQVWSIDKVPADFGAELMPPDLDRVEPIIEAAMQRIPALGDGGIKSVVNGPITFTPDANPLIGPAANLPNAWCLTGSSMGIMEGGGAGYFLAYWMTQGSPPIDALAVDSRRFGDWANREYRVEKAKECFGLQFGVHYPNEERPAGRNRRLSPLHDLMLARGAVMGVAHGKERPNWFATESTASASLQPDALCTFRRAPWFDAVQKEVSTVTQQVAMADLSVFSKFVIEGPDTLSFVNTLGCNKAPKPGRVGLTYALTGDGGVQSEFSVVLMNSERAYLNSAAGAEDIDFDLLNRHAKAFDVIVSNRSDDTAVIGLMGPASPTVLNRALDTPFNNTSRWLDVTHIQIGGIGVLALRVSYIGECGWELHVNSSHAESVFLALESAAAPDTLGFYGAYAANSMRLEKGYRSWGLDLTTERTPLETGLHHLVSSDDREYLGKEAMLRRSTTDAWTMVLLDIDTQDIDPFYSHPVQQDGRVIGMVTSGAYGHRCDKTLALAYLRETPGSGQLTIQILGQSRAATILKDVPFDPTNLRMKSLIRES